MKRAVLLVLSLLLLLAPAAPAKEAAPKKPVDAEAAAATAKANNEFAWDLYGALRQGVGNLFFSPYSIQSALMMAREGAAGTTAAQMDGVLHLEGLDRAKGYRGLRRQLRPESYEFDSGKRSREVWPYTLEIANALWGQRRYFVKNEFLIPLRDVYGAPLLRVDFGRPTEASQLINRWAARRTRNKIRNIVSPAAINPLTRLAITNAVHFKAAWKEEFSESATKPEVFFDPAGRNEKVPTMRQVEHFDCAEMDGVQILSLPYFMEQTAMVVFLPRARDGLAAIEEKLCKGEYGDWKKALQRQSRRVDLLLPRFEFAASLELSKTLAGLGMDHAFREDKADFSRVSDLEGIFLAAVLHKGWIKVDEEGTEAAAVTALDLAAGEAAPSEPVPFRADHPFLFLIRHTETGAVLFMGRVTDPK